MNEEDNNVVAGVKEVLPQVAQCVEWCAEALSKGARIIYIGAGTSGRLGLLDAVECPPTYGVSPETVVGLIAGGERAFIKAVEGAEDKAELGVQDLKDINCCADDVVIGLAASGRTPYVIGGLHYANELGCKTVGIACNKGSKVGAAAQLAVCSPGSISQFFSVVLICFHIVVTFQLFLSFPSQTFQPDFFKGKPQKLTRLQNYQLILYT